MRERKRGREKERGVDPCRKRGRERRQGGRPLSPLTVANSCYLSPFNSQQPAPIFLLPPFFVSLQLPCTHQKWHKGKTEVSAAQTVDDDDRSISKKGFSLYIFQNLGEMEGRLGWFFAAARNNQSQGISWAGETSVPVAS